MPLIKVYIHFVWSTKNRETYLATKELREIMWRHIKENAKKKKIRIDCINGYADHCHTLISIGANQTISKVMQLVKGESSNWFNKQNLIDNHFEWQDEYFAVSVSESMLKKVRYYINNQEAHHKRVTFQSEFDEMIQKLGFQKSKDWEK